MILHFTIHKMQLKRKDDEILTSYSKNFVRCGFKCQNKWVDLYKYALFIDVHNNQYIVDLGFGEYVSCKIPEEVLQGNYFSVSVFAGDRLTTEQVSVLIYPSGFNSKTQNALEDGLTIVDSDAFYDDYYHKIYDDSNYYRHNRFEIEEHPYY